METLQNCPICESAEQKELLVCIDDTVTKEKFSIRECVSCGFNFTNPRPNERQLGNYYESEDYVSHSNTSKGLINFTYQIVRKYTLRSKLNLINSLSTKGNILDIGCGTGEFLNICKENKWNTTGIEPSNKGRNQAIQNYALQVYDEAGINKLEKNKFDVITMWHVLEHVPQLQQRIEEIKTLLKKGGTLVIAVPNRMSYDAKLYKENWAGYDVPRHLYHFSPQDITNLFEKHSFKIQKIKPMNFDAFYVSMLSEKIKTGKSNFIKGLIIGSLSNIKSLFHKYTCSSQIYILRRNDSK
jgi:2-polyprenyl-3-methyl-5-hydroxy-6-metoxy-1,4-benzoquinol methylase